MSSCASSTKVGRYQAQMNKSEVNGVDLCSSSYVCRNSQATCMLHVNNAQCMLSYQDHHTGHAANPAIPPSSTHRIGLCGWSGSDVVPKDVVYIVLPLTMTDGWLQEHASTSAASVNQTKYKCATRFLQPAPCSSMEAFQKMHAAAAGV